MNDQIRRMRFLGCFVFGMLLLGCVSGCLSFEQRWREASRQMIPEGSMAGRWQGYWASETSGDRGPVRCIVTPLASGAYDARFRALYVGFVPFERAMTLRGKHSGGLYHFAGAEDLGWWGGGIYRYEGKLGLNRFFLSYDAPRDTGTFEMARVD